MAERPRTFYGGQAVMEGVMIRGRRYMAVAVRAPQSHIVVRSEPLPARLYSGRLTKIPFLRGMTLLWDTLGLGMKALMFSAEVATSGDDGPELSRPVQWGTVAVALVLGIGIFFVLPLLVVGAVERSTSYSVLSDILEGLIRLGLLVGYVAAIGLMPDIRRVYMYHGAEHMCIAAHEAGEPLVPERVRRFHKEHPRCGTSFLLIVVAASILVFALVHTPDLLARILSRVLLIPVIAGIAYEILKFGAVHQEHPLVRLLVLPGLALQAITTRVPDDSQIEVAIKAMEEVLAKEESRVEKTETGGAAPDG